MSSSFIGQLRAAVGGWWREQVRLSGRSGAAGQLARELWDFLRDSTPERRRRRYGDMDYDWEHHVNTTSGTVAWRERLLGAFLSAYQPTDPAAFREMLASLPIDFREFTFVDLGSGKGRTLLMASEYPFRNIVGVEILPGLHRAAQQNIREYESPHQRCRQIESVCADAREFELPNAPLLLYLFNPLPETGLDRVLEKLGESLLRNPRAVYVLYHNPLLEGRLSRCPWLKLICRGNHYAVYSGAGPSASPH